LNLNQKQRCQNLFKGYGIRIFILEKNTIQNNGARNIVYIVEIHLIETWKSFRNKFSGIIVLDVSIVKCAKKYSGIYVIQSQLDILNEDELTSLRKRSRIVRYFQEYRKLSD
jgi:hypothetical protein